MGLLDLFGKKSIVDCGTYLSNVPGRLSGLPRVGTDGDFVVPFIPDEKRHLVNRKGANNAGGSMDLRVKVLAAYRRAFADAVLSLSGKTVFASGSLVNDDSQGGMTALQPLDLIYAPLEAESVPEWFKPIQQNLKDPGAVAVYRIAAAADASKNPVPPQTGSSRALQAFFAHPPKPNLPRVKIDFEFRKAASIKADFQLTPELLKQRIRLDLQVAGTKQDGPGVFVGDLVIYWGNE